MEARLEASFNKRILTALGIVLTALAIATGILVALFIHYLAKRLTGPSRALDFGRHTVFRID